MPTYDFHCDTCDRDFEAWQSFTDDSTPKCPGREDGTCKSRGKGRVKKVFSPPSITFKGDGFYKNDSRGKTKSSESSSSSSESSSSTSDSSSSSTTSDSSSSSASSTTTSSSSSSD